MRKLILVLIAGMCFTVSASAQRQQALYIDNGSGAFTKITATGAGGTLNLPSSGSLLSSSTNQTINGILTLGVNPGGPTGQLNILDGGSPGTSVSLTNSSGTLKLSGASIDIEDAVAGIVQINTSPSGAGRVVIGSTTNGNAGASVDIEAGNSATNGVTVNSTGQSNTALGNSIGSTTVKGSSVSIGDNAASNDFGSRTVAGTTQNVFGQSGAVGTVTNNYFGNYSGFTTSTLAGGNVAIEGATVINGPSYASSTAVGTGSGPVTIGNATGGTSITGKSWSVTDGATSTITAGGVSPTNLKGSGSGKYAEQHTLVAGDITSANVATIPNAIVAGTTSVIVAEIVSTSAAGSLAPHGGAATTTGNVVLTLSSGGWTAGDVVNYIVVNP